MSRLCFVDVQRARMKLVYTHPNPIVVAQARSTLEHAGIDCTLRNEFAMGAIGELAPIDAWPELWVVKDRDGERAQRLLESSRQAVQGAEWCCSNCQQVNPATFELCWHCATERPEGRREDASSTSG